MAHPSYSKDLISRWGDVHCCMQQHWEDRQAALPEQDSWLLRRTIACVGPALAMGCRHVRHFPWSRWCLLRGGCQLAEELWPHVRLGSGLRRAEGVHWSFKDRWMRLWLPKLDSSNYTLQVYQVCKVTDSFFPPESFEHLLQFVFFLDIVISTFFFNFYVNFPLIYQTFEALLVVAFGTSFITPQCISLVVDLVGVTEDQQIPSNLCRM